MDCTKCGKDIGPYLACKRCARVASAIQEARAIDRACWESCEGILRGTHWIWVQECKCEADATVRHFAFKYTIGYRVVSLCGHDFSRCHSSGGLRKWDATWVNDPGFCPLCLDRLQHHGGGICEKVCLLCGGADSTHRKGCEGRRLKNKELVAKMGGL